MEKITVNTKPLGNNQFVILLDLTRNWKQIQKVKVDYSIFEKVIDRREVEKPVNRKEKIYQSDSIEKHKITMDKKDILGFPEITYDFIFDFPKENVPTSFVIYDLNISWKLNITVYFFGGLSSTFVKNINVGREEIDDKNRVT